MSRVSAFDVVAAIAPGTTPTPEQVAVIEADDAPTLVVAGAGSGKTQTMSQRIVWLVANERAAPEEILGLTFTRKAAGELAERIHAQLRRWWAHERKPVTPSSGPTVATYNSYAASVVADHALRIGHDPGARVLSEGARWQLAHEVVERFDFADDAPSSAVSTLVKGVLALSDSLAEHLLDPQDAAAQLRGLAASFSDRELAAGKRSYPKELSTISASLELRARLLRVVVAYRERKTELGAMDYADQVMLAGRLARLGAVRGGERSRFSHVILDEYQDTSVAQLEFLHALFGEAHPVMAVGDPNQSIYGWRGASAGGLNAFRETFRTARDEPAAQLHLSTAWRNDRAVLDAANVIARPLARDTGLEVPLLRPRPGAGRGEVRALYAATVVDEAHAVAEQLAQLGWGSASARPPSSAVLCRKRSQFAPLTAALRHRGIPFEVVGLGGLLSVPEVVDVVAALQAAHDPTRGDALMRLLTSARMRLGLADIAWLGDWGRQLAARRRRPASAASGDESDLVEGPQIEEDEVDERSIVEAIESLPPSGSLWRDSRGHELSAAGRERMGWLAEQLTALRRATYLPVGDLVVEAERLLGLDIELASRGGPRARVHLDRLQEVAEQFTSDQDAAPATLGAFLDYLAAIDEHERGGEPGQVDVALDRVQLLTVHAAKGLEWDVVVVPGLRDSTFPALPVKNPAGGSRRAWLTGVADLPYPLRKDYVDPDGRPRLPVLEPEHSNDTVELLEAIERFQDDVARHEVAEDRRVAYVALTRARQLLLLTGAWWAETGKTPRAPSIFLDELAAAGSLELDADPDAQSQENPLLSEPARGQWPLDPFNGDDIGRRAVLEAAAEQVRAAMAGDAGSVGPMDASDAELGSTARLVELLLREDAARRQPPTEEVELPAAASPTALTQLVHHRDRFVRNLRRPVPREPSVAALRGTLFHQWIEQRYRTTSLVDLEDLPAADDGLGADEATAELQAAFEASEWASKVPEEIEIDLVVPFGGLIVHARPDAIFAEGDGYVVVDWKSGRPPRDAEELRERELQLALYRLAWATYRGIDQSRVRAVFFFAGTGETVEAERVVLPEELPDLLAGAEPS